MASSNPSSKKIKLKLLIDKTNDRVLFAEAGKNFIDFLFHLMLLPVGTVVTLLKETGMEGSVVLLHNSIESLSNTYLKSGFNKDLLLKPKVPSFGSDSSLLLLKDNVDSSEPKMYYRCTSTNYTNCGLSATLHYGAKCPGCGSGMTRALSLVVPPPDLLVDKPTSKPPDYVKELVTYIVTDDLVVKPMSSISYIELLRSFNVKDIGAVEEKVVEFGINEGIQLLQAALQSKTVLTDVFIWNNRKAIAEIAPWS